MKKPFTAEVNDTIIANSRILKDTKVSKTIKDSARKELADTLKEQGLFKARRRCGRSLDTDSRESKREELQKKFEPLKRNNQKREENVKKTD